MAAKSNRDAQSLSLNTNHKLILQTVRERKEYGKQAHIVQEAGLPWSTGKGAIDHLIKHRLLRVSEKKELLVTEDYSLLIGISVGKKETVFVVLDFAFRLVAKDRLNLSSSPDEALQKIGFRPSGESENDAVWVRPTPNGSLTDIGDMLMQLCALSLDINEQTPVLSIGMCFGDHVDNKRNLIVRSGILKDCSVENVDINTFLDYSMIQRLRDEDINILFEQNAKAALVAERVVGCLKHEDAQNGMLVYMGSGTGAAFLLGGNILRGATNDAGSRIGHVRVLYDNEPESSEHCPGCGSSACLETALVTVFGHDYKSKSGVELVAGLNPEKASALAEYLARAVLSEVGLLELDFVVFSGKLSVIFPEIKRQFRAKASELQLKSSLRILTSELGASAAAIGAALCGYYEWLNASAEG